MRIISGRFRGRALAAVGKGDPAAHLRPTTDRIRESLFSMLQGGRFGDPISGARVLDLFAGTGALGLEALSRGALHVSFVENGARALDLLARNIEICRAGSETNVFRRDATRLGSNPGEPFSLVLLDPPYGKGLGAAALAAAIAGGWVTTDTLIVWEDDAEPQLPPEFLHIDSRRYGNTVITIAEVAS